MSNVLFKCLICVYVLLVYVVLFVLMSNVVCLICVYVKCSLLSYLSLCQMLYVVLFVHMPNCFLYVYLFVV